MIAAEVIKGVEELLGQHGLQMKTGEPLGDVVVRELGISDRQAEILLSTLHDGGTVEEALRAANISSVMPPRHSELLNKIGWAIGSVLGKWAAHAGHSEDSSSTSEVAQHHQSEQSRSGHITDPDAGATEDQVNVRATVPQRIDGHGSNVEDIAGTGETDAAGG